MGRQIDFIMCWKAFTPAPHEPGWWALRAAYSAKGSSWGIELQSFTLNGPVRQGPIGV